MLTERVKYQGKAGLFKLNFQNGISCNTGKCKLGGFSIRQSHIKLYIYLSQSITYIEAI